MRRKDVLSIFALRSSGELILQQRYDLNARSSRKYLELCLLLGENCKQRMRERMASKYLFLHYGSQEFEQKLQELKALGINFVEAKPEWPACKSKVLNLDPSAIIFDCSIKASHSRQCTSAFAELKATRDIPVYFLNVEASDKEKTIQAAPRGKITTLTKLSKFISGQAEL